MYSMFSCATVIQQRRSALYLCVDIDMSFRIVQVVMGRLHLSNFNIVMRKHDIGFFKMLGLG